MNETLLENAPLHDNATPAMGEVQECVRRVLSEGKQERGLNERRREKRHAYPYPVYLTPVAEDGSQDEEKTFAVLGKHLSECGLDFYHTQPLPYRRVIASLELANGQWVGLMMDLSWCRFNRHGWYENGGRFLYTAASPVENVA